MKIENIFKNFRKGNSVLISENYETDLECLKNYLFEKTKYLMIASLGLWNGRKNGYKISDNFFVSFGEYENFECFCYKGDVVVSASHHDGTNYILIRQIKQDLTDLQLKNLESKLKKWIADDEVDINKVIAHYSEKMHLNNI